MIASLQMKWTKAEQHWYDYDQNNELLRLQFRTKILLFCFFSASSHFFLSLVVFIENHFPLKVKWNRFNSRRAKIIISVKKKNVLNCVGDGFFFVCVVVHCGGPSFCMFSVFLYVCRPQKYSIMTQNEFHVHVFLLTFNVRFYSNGKTSFRKTTNSHFASLLLVHVVFVCIQ